MHTHPPNITIPDEDFVFRQIHKTQFKKPLYRFPSESHFSLTNSQDGLSVNWQYYCTVDNNWILIGLSYKTNSKTNNQEYKEPRDFEVFRFNVGILRSIERVEDVVYNPIFYGEHPPVGKPNNLSHSLVKYPDDEEIRLKLRDMIGQNYDEMICTPNWQFIEDELGRMRTL